MAPQHLPPTRLRVLTAAHLHQTQAHYTALAEAAQKHQPDVLTIVGDAIDALGRSAPAQLSTAACAKILTELPVGHVPFVRGNHEDDNWPGFVRAWPHDRRKLAALYGSIRACGCPWAEEGEALMGYSPTIGRAGQWNRRARKWSPNRLAGA